MQMSTWNDHTCSCKMLRHYTHTSYQCRRYINAVLHAEMFDRCINPAHRYTTNVCASLSGQSFLRAVFFTPFSDNDLIYVDNIHLTKTTAAQNEVALSYHRVHELSFLPVVFAVTIICMCVSFKQ